MMQVKETLCMQSVIGEITCLKFESSTHPYPNSRLLPFNQWCHLRVCLLKRKLKVKIKRGGFMMNPQAPHLQPVLVELSGKAAGCPFVTRPCCFQTDQPTFRVFSVKMPTWCKVKAKPNKYFGIFKGNSLNGASKVSGHHLLPPMHTHTHTRTVYL